MEEVADVRFHFLTDNTQEAMIRIGFDYVPGMQSSWSYTGTDHTYLLDKQNEPTMHFARWRRVSDECKRSDVLRAFGQVLGLELEYRHPDFYPAWITNEDGTIDEASIRAYWESELGEFISWEELKTMVLDPINVSVRFIAKTKDYDESSVMCWPFYETIARNIRPIELDANYNTTLSEMDKSFIKELYGEPGPPSPDEYSPLIEFNYTGTMPSFKVTTTKDLVVLWDAEGKEFSPINLPEYTTEFTTTVSHTYTGAGKRKITIAQILGYNEAMPTSSTALKLFDFTKASGADSITVMPYNQALETVWIRGGNGFIAQDLNFATNQYIKNLYLIGTLGSTVNVDNCKSLELLSNTPSIYTPIVAEKYDPGFSTDLKPGDSGLIQTENPVVGRPLRLPWPYTPMEWYSLGNSDGDGVYMGYCQNLKKISLDNTAIKNISFVGKKDLEYVYLSSYNSNIVGGGSPQGAYLLKAVNSLPSRSDKPTKGKIIIRAIKLQFTEYQSETEGVIPGRPIIGELLYCPVEIDRATLAQIEKICALKNWEIDWDRGTTIVN